MKPCPAPGYSFTSWGMPCDLSTCRPRKGQNHVAGEEGVLATGGASRGK